MGERTAGDTMASNEHNDSAVTPQRSISKNGTMHSIQLLRAVAALLVVLYHGQQAISARFASPAFPAESYLFAFGAVGVHIFFVISGFIMVYTTRLDQKFVARDFLRKRVFRIYPMYWICAALYFVIHYMLGSPYLLEGSEIWGALALAPENASAIIGPAWTLSFEMFFYICFGVAMKLGATRGLITLGLAFTLSIATGFLFPADGAFGRLVTNSLLLEFIAGTAVGWLLAKGRLPQRGGPIIVLFGLVLFAAGIAAGYDRLPSVIIWGIPSTLLVAGAVIWENARGFKKALRKLSHFGNSSYVLYLIHLVIITLTIALAAEVPLIRKLEPAVAAFVIAGLSLLAAEGLHAGIERPMTRSLNGFSRTRAPKEKLMRL